MGGLAHYLHSHQSTYLHLAIPSSSWVLDLNDAGWQVETAGRSIDSTPVCVSFNKTDDDRAPSVSMDPCDPIISSLAGLLLLLLLAQTDWDWRLLWETTFSSSVFDSIIAASRPRPAQRGTGF